MISSLGRAYAFPVARPLAISGAHQAAVRSFASRRLAALNAGEPDEEELKAAREWLAKLHSKSIPRHICEVSFSRSSGPGGQNVNKSVPEFIISERVSQTNKLADCLYRYFTESTRRQL